MRFGKEVDLARKLLRGGSVNKWATRQVKTNLPHMDIDYAHCMTQGLIIFLNSIANCLRTVLLAFKMHSCLMSQYVPQHRHTADLFMAFRSKPPCFPLTHCLAV